MTTATETAPDATAEPITVTVTSTAASASPVPAVASEEPTSIRNKVRGRNDRPWRSGWCGGGPCKDGTHRCRGVAENGAAVKPRYLFCACECHTEDPAAAHPVRPENENGTQA